jgi:hypothetical protein
MTSLAVLILQILCCFGLGAVILKALRVSDLLRPEERLCIGFTLGFGVLGWLLFFMGMADLFTPVPLFLVLAAGACGLAVLRDTFAPLARGTVSWSPAWQDLVLVAAIFIAISFDLLEGFSPPADADSLAYHFALPKRFLNLGGIEFVPVALEGAVPLLTQMTYVPALGLGGETSMTLWAAVSGWAAPALLFVICRRFMDVTWSLAVTLIFLTTPALIYGGGSGQVEARTAMFVLVAGIAVSDALRTGLVRYAALAGFAVGFFIGSKYFGCIFALGCGLVILLQRRWFSHGAILTLVAAAMGGEWYVWNWLHTGDPFFPTLFGVLEYTDPLVWDEAHQGAFRELYSRLETPFPANPWWFAAYPFAATLAGPAIIESGRTGLGPFGLLVFPFVIAGVWCYRKRLLSSPLAPIAAIVFLFYAFWFISDTSQRVRQLLPVYPLFLICASVAALRWAEKAGTIGPLAGAVAVTAGLQLAVHGLFAINYAKYIFTNEDRTAFLTRNVPNFAPVPWINRELTGNNLVFLYERPLIYHFDVPVYYGHPINQVLINVVPGNKDFQGFLKQLRAKSVDHLLMPFPIPRDPTVPGKSGGYGLVQELLDRECVEIRQRFETRRVASRTLPALNQRVGSFALLRMKKNACPVASNGKAGK